MFASPYGTILFLTEMFQKRPCLEHKLSFSCLIFPTQKPDVDKSDSPASFLALKIHALAKDLLSSC